MTPFELRGIEGRQGTDYCRKMMHPVPAAAVVEDRIDFIVSHCRDKNVLNIGCASGHLHSRIKSVAKYVIGVDRALNTADIQIDVDMQPHVIYGDIVSKNLPYPDLIVAGEIIEHLANPGHFLHTLRQLKTPLLITVPNALAEGGRSWLRYGYEQVNNDHVAWYSYHTLKILVERYNFKIDEFYWYGGKPLTAEGLIFVVS